MKKTLFYFVFALLGALGLFQETLIASADSGATLTSTPTADAPAGDRFTPTPVASTPASNTVTASLDTNCRKYPIRNTKAIAYLKAGQSAVAIGRERTGHWFLINNPSGEGGMPCWVWTGSTSYNGDLEKLGIVINEYNNGLPTPEPED